MVATSGEEASGPRRSREEKKPPAPAPQRPVVTVTAEQDKEEASRRAKQIVSAAVSRQQSQHKGKEEAGQSKDGTTLSRLHKKRPRARADAPIEERRSRSPTLKKSYKEAEWESSEEAQQDSSEEEDEPVAHKKTQREDESSEEEDESKDVVERKDKEKEARDGSCGSKKASGKRAASFSPTRSWDGDGMDGTPFLQSPPRRSRLHMDLDPSNILLLDLRTVRPQRSQKEAKPEPPSASALLPGGQDVICSAVKGVLLPGGRRGEEWVRETDHV
jgi:hypothetical protein